MEKKTTKKARKSSDFIRDLMDEEEYLLGRYSDITQMEAQVATDMFVQEVLNSPLGYVRATSY